MIEIQIHLTLMDLQFRGFLYTNYDYRLLYIIIVVM